MNAIAATVAAHPAHWGFHPFWPMVIIGPLMFLVIVGLLVALLVRRRRWGAPWGPAASGAAQGPWAGHAGGQGSPTRSAEQVLADRFARGDIDETEYRARLEVLRANRPEA